MLNVTDSYIENAGCQHRVKQIIPPDSKEEQVLVFLHDALGSIPQWKKFPDLLVKQTGLTATIIERQGHGTSSPFSSERNNKYLQHEALNVLPSVLNKLKIEKPILIGHSDGGSIALLYASRYSPGALIAIAAHTFVEPLILENMKSALLNAEETKSKLFKYHGDKTEELFNAWWKTWLSGEFLDWTIVDEIGDIHCPALVIQSDDDEYGTMLQVESIINQAKGVSEISIIEKGGHAPHLRFPELVAAKISDFLSVQLKKIIDK